MYKNEGAKGQVDTFIKTSNIKIRKKFDFILHYIADESNQFKEPCLMGIELFFIKKDQWKEIRILKTHPNFILTH